MSTERESNGDRPESVPPRQAFTLSGIRINLRERSIIFEAEDQPMAQLSLNILPFGHAHIETKGSEAPPVSIPERLVIYGEPETTSERSIEFTFDGDVYKTPKTTAGLLIRKKT